MLFTCTTDGCARQGLQVSVTPGTDPDTAQPIPLNVVVCGACSQQMSTVEQDTSGDGAA